MLLLGRADFYHFEMGKSYYISGQSLFAKLGKPLLQRMAGPTKKGNQIEAI